jgi:molybdopterin converting factor small subunit
VNVQELQAKRQKIATYAKWGLALIGAVIISPFIFLAVKGLVGLALAAVVGLAFINFAPMVAMKFANWKLQGIKTEAATNPIETLENVFVQKMQALDKFEGTITEFATKVKNLSDKVDTLRKQYPTEASKFEEHLSKMESVLNHRKRRYKEAKKALALFADEIKKAQVVWEVSQAAQLVTDAAGLDTGDVYERIKAETAVEAVQNSLNQAIAELETDLMNEDADSVSDEQPMLEAKKTRFEEAVVVEQPEKVKVRR